MKTRICPLCDQPMKKAHYCDSCNSFIWKPMYFDIHFNTGTTYEADCSYDIKPHDYTYYDDGSVTMMPSEQNETKRKKKFRGLDEIEFPSHSSSRNVKKDSTATPEKKGGCLKKITLIIFILSILSTVIEFIFSMATDVGDSFLVPEPQPEISIEEEWEIGDWVDPGTKEIQYTVDEVMAMGEECTAYSHMDLDWQDFVVSFEGHADEMDPYHTIEYSESTENWAYDYGSEVDTYFMTSRSYDLELEAGYYVMNWDTYSGRLHSLDFDVYGKEQTEYYFVQTMYALQMDGEEFRDEFRKQISVAEDEGYVFYDTEGYEIYISYFDGVNDEESSYYISITKPFYE